MNYKFKIKWTVITNFPEYELQMYERAIARFRQLSIRRHATDSQGNPLRGFYALVTSEPGRDLTEFWEILRTMKTIDGEYVTRMKDAIGSMGKFTESARIHTWLTAKGIQPELIKEFNEEFVNRNNLAAETALNHWAAIIPEPGKL